MAVRLIFLIVWTFITLFCTENTIFAKVLTPPYFNLAQGRDVTATSTCGIPNPEIYCRLTGATGEKEDADTARDIIWGQLCDFCDPRFPDKTHKPEFAIDGTERWWQSPPLSRGMNFNDVNLTIDLGQEFHVAYVFIKMAISPRPGVWTLERSTDYGKTWDPWQYFADSPSACVNLFQTKADREITSDSDVVCSTRFSKIVPLEAGEIVISLVNGRPSARNFSHSETLKNWTKATNVRIQLIQTKTLLGHLMDLEQQDATVTRRYFYSIKDISIGGRCVCNGHAESCDSVDPNQPNKLLCNCQHNTCGEQCGHCCPGFVQKKWHPARVDHIFICEPCQCYGRTNDCEYDEEIDDLGLSVDVFGIYAGGGVCRNCRYNTEGINCEKCVDGYYRPYNVPVNVTDACQLCVCDPHFHTGRCAEGSGKCECRREFTGDTCDRCSYGYYAFPNCIPCDCNLNGTENSVCTVGEGQCPCKENFAGRKCNMCAFGYYGLPECNPCECNSVGSTSNTCDMETGQCQCQLNYGSMDCSKCAHGYFGFPGCDLCECDPAGTEEQICHKSTGICLCRPSFSGSRCDQCGPMFYSYPDCIDCGCQDPGSLSLICADSGQCACKPNYAGLSCGRCAPGYYRYPDCMPCNCDIYGSIGVSCDQEIGQCNCKSNFHGLNCRECREHFFNYPICEECDCDPSGAMIVPGYPLGGCGSVTAGQLCECKERVMGRICDICKPGYWNLNRNNLLGCEECHCFGPGTIAGINVCSMNSGQCMCKVDVGGQNCDQCEDEFYNLVDKNPFGCIECKCNIGGSISPVCNKGTGQCVCKPRVTGRRCDRPIGTHYFPDLHQKKWEVEDGHTPEGTRIRYGHEEDIFPGFSWRGYAILSQFQPEVVMDIVIDRPSLYRLVYHYINRNANHVSGDVTFTPNSPMEDEQTGEIIFMPSNSPAYSTVGVSGLLSPFILRSGRWVVSLNVPDTVFLDYMVLIPQAYYEASVLKSRIAQPCLVPGDDGPCLHYNYPDLQGYPTIRGERGYYFDGNQTRRRIKLYTDQSVLTELGVPALAKLDYSQRTVYLDLEVPDPGKYILVVNYLSNSNHTQRLSVTVPFEEDKQEASAIIYNCQYSSLCRQVLTDLEERTSVFNISTGRITLGIQGPVDVDVAIDSISAIPEKYWSVDYIQPSIVCIRVNGVCSGSRYSSPTASVRIDFESPPNEGRQSVEMPMGILDENVGLVRLNESNHQISIGGSARTPTQHVFLIHYYLPSDAGSNIDIGVNVNGQYHHGIFRPRYCPSTTGCRGIVQFDGVQNDVLTLRSTELDISVTSSTDQNIWLDYALLIPASQFTSTDLQLQPVDNSDEFLEQCIGEGFQIRDSTSGFCRDGVFTLTSDFNNGAISCNCDIDGSLGFNCEQYGGQCPCRPHVIGRTCSTCQPNYYGFPRCKPCDCPYGLCQEMTGECICPPHVTGEKCDTCEPGTYGFDPLIGCEECKCNLLGIVDGDMNCDQNTGHCRCLPNIGGRKCGYCLSGFFAYPRCDKCNCDLNGTVEDICDQQRGACLCKPNVEGRRCDDCAPETFFLNPRNPDGCTKCFCSGTTSRCDSANLIWGKIVDMADWGISNTKDGEVRDAGDTVAILDALEKISNPQEAMYWIAPPAYLGNKILSYGGKLHYKVLFILPRDAPAEVYGLIRPDVVLKGNNMTLVHGAPTQAENGRFFEYSVSLVEHNFAHATTGAKVTREQMMMIFINLQALHIRGSYYNLVDEIRMQNVELDVAMAGLEGEPSLSVENCGCSVNYDGTSCEDCSRGYYRSLTALQIYRGICIPCECNGHAETCDPLTGQCINCSDNTIGFHCEECLAGYYGYPETGPCRICGCPLDIPSNNFAATCSVTEDGYVLSCDCSPGYAGSKCERCAPGYYGNPNEPGNTCQPCGCSGNIDMTNPESCNRLTGECLICEYFTAGDYCEYCRDWFYGDAIEEKNCQPCTCNQCGTKTCLNVFGACECKPNVVGPDCNDCAPNTWGFEHCNGCIDCDCHTASIAPQCDIQNGQCACQPGVTGLKCESCIPGYWNYGPHGCHECECMSDGAITCDSETGQCKCLPGVTGDRCDRCLPRWVLIPEQGCHACDNCVHLLLDDMEVLDQNITTIERKLKSVSFGVEAFWRLDRFSEAVTELKPKVDNLFLQTQNISLAPLHDSLDQQRMLTDKVLARSENVVSDGENIEEYARTLRGHAYDASVAAQHSEKDASDAVKFAKEVFDKIVQRILVTSIDIYIQDSEEILEELNGRNFSNQKMNAHAEVMEAEDALKKVNMIHQGGIMELNNKTVGIGNNIDSISMMLTDLQNSSQYSQLDSHKALEIVAELKSRLPDLKDHISEILVMEEYSVDMLYANRHLLDDAEGANNDCGDAFVDLEQNLSRLMDGQATTRGVVSELEMGLEGVKPLVNQSIQHAMDLQSKAALLASVYTDTRDIASKALEAANAYENIAMSISDAKNGSKNALAAAQDALLKSRGVGEESADSKQISTTLLVMAKGRYAATQTDLANLMDKATESVEKVEKLNDRAKSERDELSNSLGNIARDDISTTANRAINEADGAKVNLDETETKVIYILNQIPEDKYKIKKISDDTINTSRDMNRASGQVNTVKSLIPNINNLLITLAARSQEIMELGNVATRNITKLRESISLARSEANRIRVGLKFLGNTTVNLRNPENLVEAGSYSSVSLFLKTNQESALLAYVGDEKTEGRMSPDYLALELRNGQVVFRFNLGSDPAVVAHPWYVANNKWYKVTAERIGKDGTLKLMRYDGDTESPEEVEVKGTSPGLYTVLELKPSTSKFFLGGVPDSISLPEDITVVNYIGVMEEVKFDKTPVGLWNFAGGMNNYVGAMERDVLETELQQGYQFNGNGYVILSTTDWQPNKESFITLQVKSFVENGLLFFMSDGERDFMSLELHDGKFLFQYDLGSSRARLMSEKTYNDGKWHIVQAMRIEKDGALHVDDNVVHGVSPGSLKELSYKDNIYIGGYNDIVLPVDGVVPIGFDGCISEVRLGDKEQNLHKMQGKGVIAGCPEQIAREISFTAERRGYVSMPLESIGESFDITFRVKTNASHSLLLYTADTKQTDAFSVSVMNGHIIVISSGGGTKKELKSRGNTYNDSFWHYISIMKTPSKLILNIDDHAIIDSPMMEQIETNRPLYFGGTNFEVNMDMVASKTSLVGCIGDVTVNGRFLNFASLPERDRVGVSLAGCMVEESGLHVIEETVDEIVTTAVPIPPDQCALPLKPDIDPADDVVSGTRFGTYTDSRVEYDALPGTYKLSFKFSIDIKTTAEEGVIFYVSDKKHRDFLALYMINGKVVFSFDCGTGDAVIESPMKYNDGQWHNVIFARSQKDGTLQIDGQKSASGRSPGRTRSINVVKPFYLGGLTEEVAPISKNNLQGLTLGFMGCIRNFMLGNKDVGQPINAFGVQPCSSLMEAGTFFYSEGGQLKLYDNFNVGLDLAVDIEVKARSLDGVILAVHSSKGGDYLILEISDGELILTANNGAGAFSTRYLPDVNNRLCDGKWHSIRAVKAKNVVMLVVNGAQMNQGIGTASVSATDTNDPLYIGGVPAGTTKGIESTGEFVGCIRNLRLNDRIQYLTAGEALGAVKMDMCPVG